MTVRLRHSKTGDWILPVKVTPKGSKNCLLPFSETDTAIALKVTAPPEDGKANTAVIALLAKQLQLPKSQLKIVAGETSRLKQVAISVAWTFEDWQQRLSILLQCSPDWFVIGDS